VSKALRKSLPLLVCLVGNHAAASPQSATPPAPLRKPTLVIGTAEATKGVMVEAGPHGAVWKFPGGGTVTARAGAVLRVWASGQIVYLGAKKTRTYTVTLDSGTVRVKVPAGGETAIVVAAPHESYALVSNGEAAVHVGAQVAVAKVSGTTLVRVGGDPFRPLDTGSFALLARDGDHRQPLLGSPAAVRGPTVLVSFGDPVGTKALAWEPIPGAVAYRADIRRAGSEAIEASVETSQPRLEAGAALLDPGVHELRLTAVDATGMESAVPLVRNLRVIQVQVPDGGHVDSSGAVRIPQGRSVQLTGTEGVEMTYGNGANFFPAPATLEFYQAEPRLVRLRGQGESDVLSLWLLPREAHAQVEFGSVSPHWPGEPLQIRVRLTDAGGDDMASRIELHPEVLVGIEPVKVEFTREGDWLSGALPGRPGSGPWVVRVEVRDQHGIQIGRDFVEVSGTTTSAASRKSGNVRASVAMNRRGS
jgi:hypothetical protein